MRNSAGTKRVLIVEDEARAGLALAEALKDEGHRVIGPVESQSEAIAALEQTRPDVAILDLTLRDGFCAGLADDLRHRGIPFMIFSGQRREDAVVDELDGVPWVEKPGGLNEITAALDSLVTTSEQHPEWSSHPQAGAPITPSAPFERSGPGWGVRARAGSG
jgi:DNA-binding response OmpR family regulator